MSEIKMYNVKNRSASMVVYRIPEKGIRREFMPGEEKKIAYDELQALVFQSGGRELMVNFLQIQSDEVREELNIHTEIEYNYSETDIVNLLKDGSLDAFLDCLDFAPVGVIDLVKKLAISLPLSDLAKVKALKEKTGFDVAKALANIEAEKAEDESAEAAAPANNGRRVKPAEKATTPERRTTGYKIVNKSEE